MGRVASAGDNAAMESFFALLQTNVLDRRRWRTRDELRYAIIRWIEHTYNRQRRQRALGKSPRRIEPRDTRPSITRNRFHALQRQQNSMLPLPARDARVVVRAQRDLRAARGRAELERIAIAADV